MRASSGMIGTTRAPISGSRSRLRSSRANAVVVLACTFSPVPASTSAYASSRRRTASVFGAHDALGHRAVERAPARHHVLVLGRVGARVAVRRVAVVELGVGDRQLQPVAERLQLVGGQLLDLVRRVARLDARRRASSPSPSWPGSPSGCPRARPPSCRRRRACGSRGRRAAACAGRRRTGARPSAAAAGRDRRSARGCTRRDSTAYFWNSPSTVLFILLTSTPSTSRASSSSHAAAPDHLDHVPARAAEDRLELLDDLAVAAHRTVEALQVAVDDEDQVVELLACRDRQAGHRLGLVHLAVADERPHLRLRSCRRSRGAAGSG